MKINLSSMKFIIRLLILLILFVIVYLISCILYSARYWPDIYNYVNANITIKRIPTLSELNLTEIEIVYTTDYTTSGYDFTTDYAEDETMGKREVVMEEVKDYSELPTRSVIVEYMFDVEDSTKFVKDLIDDAETARGLKDKEIVGSQRNVEESEKAPMMEESLSDELKGIVPWIVTIFVMNKQKNNQFDYFCDGALLSKKTVLTAARCVHIDNTTMNPEDVFVVVGKKGLTGTGPNEKAHRIVKILPHDNFTNNELIENDLAILLLDEAATISEDVVPANLSSEVDFDADSEKSATTAWAYTGDLNAVFFEKVQNRTCPKDDYVDNTICATYGNSIPLCPSFGGIYVAKHEGEWLLQGIMYGDPTDKGLCISKNVTYTSLRNYLEWINDTMNKYM